MQDTVIRTIERPSDDLVAFFADQTAADVHEAMGKRRAMDAAIGPVAGPPTVCGPAVTARIPSGDNTMTHVASEVAEQGDVIVFESATTATATWGELATRNAMGKGLAGVVSDGNVRDVAAIDDLSFPVFSRAVSQSGARKEGNGSVNVPVCVGGVQVAPGDIIVGDKDGVTVVPREAAASVREATEAKRAAEDDVRAALGSCESLYDVIGIEELLDGSDVRMIEGPVDGTDPWN